MNDLPYRQQSGHVSSTLTYVLLAKMRQWPFTSSHDIQKRQEKGGQGKGRREEKRREEMR
eukprot:753428-Hanusia_phi.AAC.5